MTSKAEAQQAKPANTSADTMQQVRELLFGEYQRQVETQLDKATANLERLRQETEHRRTALEHLLVQRIEQLDQQNDASLKALESSLREELQTLQGNLEQRIDDLQTLLESDFQRFRDETRQQLDQLTSAKADRKQLAGLMRQLADSLET